MTLFRTTFQIHGEVALKLNSLQNSVSFYSLRIFFKEIQMYVFDRFSDENECLLLFFTFLPLYSLFLIFSHFYSFLLIFPHFFSFSLIFFKFFGFFLIFSYFHSFFYPIGHYCNNNQLLRIFGFTFSISLFHNILYSKLTYSKTKSNSMWIVNNLKNILYFITISHHCL